MLRRWTTLGLSMATVIALTVGVSTAQDEESPLHKIMTKVNSAKVAIFKGVRSAVAFKNSQKAVATNAEELAKLSKEARAFKEPSEKQKLPYEQWTKLMDDMTKAAQELAKVAKKEGVTQTEAKKAYTAVNASCTACHKVFRIDEP